MRYTVVWRPSALDELAQLWNQAPDKGAVTMAANTIDRELRMNAHRKGQVLTSGEQIYYLPPLGVFFTVEPDDCMVTVLKAFRIS